jgi:predicted negative regulator of RcsB-dependent stress response
MKIIAVVLLALILGFLAGLSYMNSKQMTTAPERLDLFDKIYKNINKNKIEYVKQDTFIFKEKIKLRLKFIAVDSLSFDSAYKLWTTEANAYEPGEY